MRYGIVVAEVEPVVAPRLCSVQGCERPARKRGWCSAHYNRAYNGRPLDSPLFSTPEERFWAKVDKDGPVSQYRPDLGRCWLWTGCIDQKGYGGLTAGRPRRAHRFSYELTRGVIPPGLQLDHLCRVRACVNPDHLEPVTHAENVRRGQVGAVNRARLLSVSHCVHGHAFDETNTRWRNGHRHCRACEAHRSLVRRRAVV